MDGRIRTYRVGSATGIHHIGQVNDPPQVLAAKCAMANLMSSGPISSAP
jgi:hypothetical protein